MDDKPNEPIGSNSSKEIKFDSSRLGYIFVTKIAAERSGSGTSKNDPKDLTKAAKLAPNKSAFYVSASYTVSTTTDNRFAVDPIL